MATRTSKIGTTVLKYMPIGAVGLAVYQYYQSAGGMKGFVYDIKNLDMGTLQANWEKVAMGLAFFAGAGTISKFVPGKGKYIVEAIMYYFGASQMLDVLNAMYSPVAISNGNNAAAVGARGY